MFLFEGDHVLDKSDVSVLGLFGESQSGVELKGAGRVARVNAGGVIEDADDNFGRLSFAPVPQTQYMILERRVLAEAAGGRRQRLE